MIEMAIVGLGSWGVCGMERGVSRGRGGGPPPPCPGGLAPWAVGWGYRWVGYECRIGAGGDPILPTDYLPRRLMGEYLAWFYDRLVAEAPPNLEIVRHYAAAVDISPDLQGREEVLLDS